MQNYKLAKVISIFYKHLYHLRLSAYTDMFDMFTCRNRRRHTTPV